MTSESKPIRKDVAEANDRAWPDGVVDMPLDSDDSYFWDVYPKLKRDLSRIKDATLLYEDPPDFDEGSRSYYLFFIRPADEAFTIEVDGGGQDEDADLETVQDQSIIGCSVAISLIAPFVLRSLREL